MNRNLQQLEKYLNEIGIGELRIEVLPDAKRKLPVFIGQAYEFHRVCFSGKRYALLLRKAADRPTPVEAKKQVEIVKAKLGEDAMFVFQDLKPFERKRWVEKGIPFVVPGRHFHCPMYLLDFRDRANRSSPCGVQSRESISASAQVLLLYYLLREVGDHNLAEWAELLRYTRMTISRAKKELEEAGLCEISDRGKSVFLQFSLDKKALWESAKPFLRSPVARSAYVEINAQHQPQLLLAGVSSLSKVSMLADDPVPTYAMSSSAYRIAIEEGQIIERPVRSEGSAIIQQWRYLPGLLAGDQVSVDRLSLYLSLRDEPDERVQMELVNIMEDISW